MYVSISQISLNYIFKNALSKTKNLWNEVEYTVRRLPLPWIYSYSNNAIC